MNPKVSIAIPAHNRSEYLRQALLWSLGQIASDLEVVVSDDCSTEDLHSVVSAFDDSRIRYYQSTERLGAAKNHQRAVQLARGQYVITLNSDDLLLPSCLETAIACLEKKPEAGAVFFSVTYLTNGQVKEFQAIPKTYYADNEVLKAAPWLEKFHGTTPSCCLFRKEAFERIQGYRTSLRFAYDWDFYMRMMRIGGGVIFLPKILGVYRRHEEQMVLQHSLDALKDILDLWQMPEYRHWPAVDIAELLLTETRNLQLRGQPTRAAFYEVLQRGLFWRVAMGVPGAIWARLSRRMQKVHASVDQNYAVPENVEDAIATANELLRRETPGSASTAQ